jgi:GNAT superfamily N-acetyltransferase
MKLRIDLLSNAAEYSSDISQWLFVEWGDMFIKLTDTKTVEDLSLYYTSIADKVFVGYDEDTKKFICSCCLENDDMKVYSNLSPWFSKLFVVPEYRGEGIATKLVLYALDYIDTNTDIKNLFVWVDNTNVGLVKFFETNGFFVIGTHSQHGKYKELVILERRHK